MYQSQGRMDALGILFNRYIELVYGVSLKYLKSSDDSQDAVMQVFELITIKLKKHQVENFKSWLHVVTKNHCLERIRKNKKKLTLVSEDQVMHSDHFAHHDDEFEFELTDDIESLNDCIKQLPEKQKEAIDLFYLKGKSYQDIAELKNENKARIRSYIQNGRRNLKNCMEKKNGKAL